MLKYNEYRRLRSSCDFGRKRAVVDEEEKFNGKHGWLGKLGAQKTSACAV
jgi:hypothetical protein